MIRKNKWLDETTPDQPWSAAARQAVESRWSLVWHYLAQAVEPGERNVEDIHQLRVWSRRAETALDVFHEALPRRKTRKVRKQLKRLRRAAGEARDLDVLAQRLAGDEGQPPEHAVPLTLEMMADLRRQARGPIEQLHRRLKRKKFARRVAAVLKRVCFRGRGSEPTFGHGARQSLCPVVTGFCEHAHGDLSDPAALHALRIAGKQLRYTLELFSGAFGPELREELYPQVEKMQELLGEINDHAAAIGRLEHWAEQAGDAEHREELARLLAAERSALGEARKGFTEWWTPEQRQSIENRLTALLAAPQEADGSAGQESANGDPN